eukprot:scaffold334_cov241-Pinguiococcus_pyrenoidosus.AAC.79
MKRGSTTAEPNEALLASSPLCGRGRSATGGAISRPSMASRRNPSSAALLRGLSAVESISTTTSDSFLSPAQEMRRSWHSNVGCCARPAALSPPWTITTPRVIRGRGAWLPTHTTDALRAASQLGEKATASCVKFNSWASGFVSASGHPQLTKGLFQVSGGDTRRGLQPRLLRRGASVGGGRLVCLADRGVTTVLKTVQQLHAAQPGQALAQLSHQPHQLGELQTDRVGDRRRGVVDVLLEHLQLAQEELVLLHQLPRRVGGASWRRRILLKRQRHLRDSHSGSAGVRKLRPRPDAAVPHGLFRIRFRPDLATELKRLEVTSTPLWRVGPLRRKGAQLRRSQGQVPKPGAVQIRVFAEGQRQHQSDVHAVDDLRREEAPLKVDHLDRVTGAERAGHDAERPEAPHPRCYLRQRGLRGTISTRGVCAELHKITKVSPVRETLQDLTYSFCNYASTREA